MSAPRRRWLTDDRGSAPAEFAMVAVLLTALALGVVQLALALHVRNTAIDAAVEGARHAGLVGSSLDAGAERTRTLLTLAVSDGYVADVSAREVTVGGASMVEVRVRSALPVFGLLGPDRALEVTGHAPLERLAD
ncbi:TadE family protein [Herbiconiux sp. L3-i23]|uniref:TadE family protein n=1 Tax=Herbiconiux sp. L3-i23 TaxID=2905871 RepID=UPI00204DEB7A|nr:TadE family protein [Herbiconiux sp. L3-i23]BDI23356.1 hypothetical protein L3i23_21320 [Herbiconiux sp. L3-i23]